MFVGTNIRLTKIPNLGCCEEETLFSANRSDVIQHGWLWNNSIML